jgi:hypothetical protein
MKWLTTLVAIAGVLALAGTSTAGSAGKDPRVPALQKQVVSLTKQVATLQQQVQHDELVVTCGFATQMAYNTSNLDLWATLLSQPPYSGPQPNDGGACAKVGQPAPTVRTLSALGSVGSLQAALRTRFKLARMR